MAASENVLYYGDNLPILQQYIKDESVDLIYLDPPFNSNADYNVLFHEQDGSRITSRTRKSGQDDRLRRGTILRVKQFSQWLFNGIVALSLVLWIATAAVWVRDLLLRNEPRESDRLLIGHHCVIHWRYGEIELDWDSSHIPIFMGPKEDLKNYKPYGKWVKQFPPTRMYGDYGFSFGSSPWTETFSDGFYRYMGVRRWIGTPEWVLVIVFAVLPGWTLFRLFQCYRGNRLNVMSCHVCG